MNQASVNCDCNCAKPTTFVPMTGFGLGLDLSGIQPNLQPGPDGTHLVSRGGQLVWENINDTGCFPQVPDYIYVETTGDDNNDGLTPETAFATIQAAINSTAKYPQLGKSISLIIGEGTFSEAVEMRKGNNYDFLRLIGISGKTVIAGTITARNSSVALHNLHIKGDPIPLHVIRNSFVSASGCTFETTKSDADACTRVTGSSELFLTNTTLHAYSGTSQAVSAYSGASLQLGGKVSFYGSVSGAVVYCSGSNVHFNTSSSTEGTITGKRYDIRIRGSIRVSGGSKTYIPGTVAGTEDTTGYGS